MSRKRSMLGWVEPMITKRWSLTMMHKSSTYPVECNLENCKLAISQQHIDDSCCLLLWSSVLCLWLNMQMFAKQNNISKLLGLHLQPYAMSLKTSEHTTALLELHQQTEKELILELSWQIYVRTRRTGRDVGISIRLPLKHWTNYRARAVIASAMLEFVYYARICIPLESPLAHWTSAFKFPATSHF